MSEFVSEERELDCIDCEIHKYAVICGVDIENLAELDQFFSNTHDAWAEDKSRETLIGLLLLRAKLEDDMRHLGHPPPPLCKSHQFPRA
jgi:hypothetical protein